MKQPKLSVEKRTVLGKKVKKLRQEGILPGNIYGKDITSEAVQLPEKEFKAVYKEVGETGLVDLTLDGKAKPVLIHNVQLDPLTHSYLHADFYQVNLKEKIKAMVPLILTGEPKAVAEKVGLLLQTLSEVEVEALPQDLPEHIEVNVEALAAIDEQITVDNLKAPKGVAILTDPSQVVAKISELVSKEAEEQAKEEATAAEAAKATSDVTKAEAGTGVETELQKPEGQKPQAEKPKPEEK